MGRNRSPVYRGCTSKDRHATEGEALEVASACKRRGFPGADRLRAYECDACGGYHLTSSPPRVGEWIPSLALRAAQGT